MYDSIYGKCEKCGADLKAIDTIGYYDDRHLCSKCRASEQSMLIGAQSVTLPTCDKCGASVDVSQFTISGRRLCNNCLVSEYGTLTDVPSLKYSLGIPTASGTIGINISDLEKGIFDTREVSMVDPRDEQIAKLEAKIEELERAGYEDKEELKNYRERLAVLEKKVHGSDHKKATYPSFIKLCQLLEHWFPRRIRRYEESYKAELTEYLSNRFPHVKEEAEGGLCDILVSKRHPIHLKLEPNLGAYDTLLGQISRTLERFAHVACVIIGISSSEQYYEFVSRAIESRGTSKVRFFPKAR